jgi:flagellar hook-associated protein 3 FlgL
VRQELWSAARVRRLQLGDLHRTAHVDGAQQRAQARVAVEFGRPAKLRPQTLQRRQRHCTVEQPETQPVQTIQQRQAPSYRAAPPIRDRESDVLESEQRCRRPCGIRRRRRLADQNERVGQRLQLMDGALGSVADIAARARTALVQRIDGGFGSDVPLDDLVDTMLAEVESALNTRIDGQYLFAGSRSDVAPVALPTPPPTVADSSLYYRGDSVRLTTRGDVGFELAYGVTADAVPFAELIATLGQAREAHLADDRVGLTAAMAGLETALDGVTGLRAGVGIAAERLEAVTEGQRSAILYLDEVVAGIEDTDLAAVLIRIASDQATLEAGYSVTGKLASLSLADYLR